MNTFLTGREGGTEPDKETVERRQSEEVLSCGCEEACSRRAVVSRTHTHAHARAAFGVFRQTQNEELVSWLQLNRIWKERFETPFEISTFLQWMRVYSACLLECDVGKCAQCILVIPHVVSLMLLSRQLKITFLNPHHKKMHLVCFSPCRVHAYVCVCACACVHFSIPQ